MSRTLIFILLFSMAKAGAQNASAVAVGDSLYGLGDYSKAILAYKTASENETVLYKLAKSYEALGNNLEAMNYYEQLIGLNPKAVIVKYSYGKLLAENGKVPEAIEIFEQLSEENQQNPNLYYQLGLAQEKVNDSTAYLNFQKAYQLDTNHLNALYKIAKRKVEKRDFTEAKALIGEGLKSQESSARFLLLDALANYHTDNYHAAIKSFEQLAQQNYNTTQLHEILAKSYARTNQFEKAIDQFTILINRFDDTYPSWHYEIGKCFMALHYFDKAEQHLNLAIALQEIPLDPEYTTLARIYKRQKYFQKEMQALEKALVENPKNELAQYELAVAADNYFEDKESVLRYYKIYLEKYGETGRMRELAKQRISDLNKELHFTKH